MSRRKNMILAAVFVLVCTAAAATQETAEGKLLTGQAPAVTSTSISGTVVHVAGNDLLMRLDSGELKDYRVAPDATVTTEDGATVTLRDTKPGLRLGGAVATTATPRRIEAVHPVTGRVWHVQPPATLILTLPEGNRMYRVPEGQKFNIEGAEHSVWDLRKGQEVTATVVTAVPLDARNGFAGPLEMPVLAGALLVEEVEIAQAQASAPPATPPELPGTASLMPLLGLLGVLLIGVSLGMSLIRS